MTVNIEAVAAFIGAAGIIISPIIFLFKKVLKVMRRLDENYEDICSSKSERKILIKGTLACLRGLEELGCNGPVKKAIAELEEHMIDESHR